MRSFLLIGLVMLAACASQQQQGMTSPTPTVNAFRVPAKTRVDFDSDSQYCSYISEPNRDVDLYVKCMAERYNIVYKDGYVYFDYQPPIPAPYCNSSPRPCFSIDNSGEVSLFYPTAISPSLSVSSPPSPDEAVITPPSSTSESSSADTSQQNSTPSATETSSATPTVQASASGSFTAMDTAFVKKSLITLFELWGYYYFWEGETVGFVLSMWVKKIGGDAVILGLAHYVCGNQGVLDEINSHSHILEVGVTHLLSCP